MQLYAFWEDVFQVPDEGCQNTMTKSRFSQESKLDRVVGQSRQSDVICLKSIFVSFVISSFGSFSSLSCNLVRFYSPTKKHFNSNATLSARLLIWSKGLPQIEAPIEKVGQFATDGKCGAIATESLKMWNNLQQRAGNLVCLRTIRLCLEQWEQTISKGQVKWVAVSACAIPLLTLLTPALISIWVPIASKAGVLVLSPFSCSFRHEDNPRQHSWLGRHLAI